MFKNKRYILSFLIFILFLVHRVYCEERLSFPRPYKEEKMLSLRYGIEIEFMMSEAEGVWGPDAFFITKDHGYLFISDSLDKERIGSEWFGKIKIFNLGTKKLFHSFKKPFPERIRQMYVDPNENIIYSYISSPYGENIIRKVDSKNNTLFELIAEEVPSELADKINRKFAADIKTFGFSPPRGKSKMSWRYFLSTKKENFL